MQVKIKKLVPEAVIPFKATVGSAGFDLVATSVKYDDKNDCWVYGIGISTEIPKNHVGFIFPRSSNRKTDYYLPNSIGCVDAKIYINIF